MVVIKNRDGLETNDNWQTPDWLMNELDAVFHFDFDPYPVDPQFNGHEVNWLTSNYANPPYNRIDKPKAIQKAYNEWKHGNTCVLLIPAATGTKQFHELLLPNSKVISYDEFKIYQPLENKIIAFFKGRLSFKGYNTKGEYSETNKGKHDSMLIILQHVELSF